MAEGEVGTVMTVGGRKDLDESEEQLPATSPSVPQLLQLAIDKGVDVGVLERLVGLQERVTERNARSAFFDAVAAFQEECPEIAKTKKANIATRGGGAFNYNYAPLEQITRTIRPYLRKHNLSYTFTTEISKDHPGVLHVVCILRHTEGHEERASFPVPIKNEAAMSEAQKVGSALTFGRRNALISVLGLTTADEDDDAPDRVSGQVISPEQVESLNMLIDKAGESFNMVRFLKHMQVEHMGQIPVEKFNTALQAINATMKGVRR